MNKGKSFLRFTLFLLLYIKSDIIILIKIFQRGDFHEFKEKNTYYCTSGWSIFM